MPQAKKNLIKNVAQNKAGSNIASLAMLHDHKIEFNNTQIINITLYVAHCISNNADKDAIRIGPSNTEKKEHSIYIFSELHVLA